MQLAVHHLAVARLVAPRRDGARSWLGSVHRREAAVGVGALVGGLGLVAALAWLEPGGESLTALELALPLVLIVLPLGAAAVYLALLQPCRGTLDVVERRLRRVHWRTGLPSGPGDPDP